MNRVVRTDQAEDDLVDILVYLRRRDERAADRFEADFEGKCRILAQFPMMGRARPELTPSLRSFAINPYVIFYEPLDDGVRIVRVIHGSRDISSMFID